MLWHRSSSPSAVTSILEQSEQILDLVGHRPRSELAMPLQILAQHRRADAPLCVYVEERFAPP